MTATARRSSSYAFGEDVLAVADGTIVSTRDGMPDETPLQAMIPKAKEDYGGGARRVAPTHPASA
jgi:hypothetical protein